jgi:isovaleryl-CoA dehydrogenase
MPSSTVSTAEQTGGTVFGLGDDHREILEQVDRFARKELYPLQRRMDDEEWWPEQTFRLFGDNGYLGVMAPAELGGAGLDFFASGLVVQAVARWNPAIALSLLVHENLCMNNILANGSDELLGTYIPGMCEGRLVGALGLTEPGAGSDALGGMRTTARQQDDQYVLNGTKLFITNGPIADLVLVYAKTDLDAGPHGISAFVVPTDSPGFSVSQKLVKMGLRGSQTAELVFDDCRVPAANLVGEENRGVAVVMSGLDLERVGLSFLILGMAERALELTVEYARSRRQFGRPISDFQLVQGMVADIYAELESLRSFTYHVGAEINALAHGEARSHVAKRAAAVILQAGRTFTAIADRALQVHGGAGYIWETEINRLYRAGKLWEIGAGTTEIRQLIIARELLGR